MQTKDSSTECTPDPNQMCQVINNKCTCVEIHPPDDRLNFLLVGVQVGFILVAMGVVTLVCYFIFGNLLAPLYLSVWLGVTAIAHIVYPQNYINNSFVVASMLPIAFLLALTLNDYILDVGHGIILFVAILLLLLNRPISLIWIGVFSGVMILWYTIFYDIIYSSMPDPLTFTFTIVVNAILVILVQRFRPKKIRQVG